MSLPTIKTGQALPGAILFVSVRRNKDSKDSPMIAYDPWAENGDTIDDLRRRWASKGLYRERLSDSVKWAGSPKGLQRYVGGFGQSASDTSPRWPYTGDSKIGKGLLLSLTVPLRRAGTQPIPDDAAIVTADYIYGGVEFFGDAAVSPPIPVYPGSQYSFDKMGYYDFSITFYAMADGTLNLKVPRANKL